jgi:hypothetical protein
VSFVFDSNLLASRSELRALHCMGVNFVFKIHLIKPTYIHTCLLLHHHLCLSLSHSVFISNYAVFIEKPFSDSTISLCCCYCTHSLSVLCTQASTAFIRYSVFVLRAAAESERYPFIKSNFMFSILLLSLSEIPFVAFSAFLKSRSELLLCVCA